MNTLGKFGNLCLGFLIFTLVLPNLFSSTRFDSNLDTQALFNLTGGNGTVRVDRDGSGNFVGASVTTRGNTQTFATEQALTAAAFGTPVPVPAPVTTSHTQPQTTNPEQSTRVPGYSASAQRIRDQAAQRAQPDLDRLVAMNQTRQDKSNTLLDTAVSLANTALNSKERLGKMGEEFLETQELIDETKKQIEETQKQMDSVDTSSESGANLFQQLAQIQGQFLEILGVLEQKSDGLFDGMQGLQKAMGQSGADTVERNLRDFQSITHDASP